MPAHGIQAFESEHSGMRARERGIQGGLFMRTAAAYKVSSVRANELKRGSDDFTRPVIIVASIESMMALGVVHYLD